MGGRDFSWRDISILVYLLLNLVENVVHSLSMFVGLRRQRHISLGWLITHHFHRNALSEEVRFSLRILHRVLVRGVLSHGLYRGLLLKLVSDNWVQSKR